MALLKTPARPKHPCIFTSTFACEHKHVTRTSSMFVGHLLCMQVSDHCPMSAIAPDGGAPCRRSAGGALRGTAGIIAGAQLFSASARRRRRRHGLAAAVISVLTLGALSVSQFVVK